MLTNYQTNDFQTALAAALTRRGQSLTHLCDAANPIEQRILLEYGAIFIAAESVVTPPVCMFADAAAVDDFQNNLDISSAEINGAMIELQSAALDNLLAARREAAANHLNITPRGGAEAARRSFDDTVRLWQSRVLPALEYWTERNEISAAAAENLQNLSLREQIAAVLELEERGVYFSKDFAKSILYSVAAPGCSQHLSLLAFDAAEFDDAAVREILRRHGWFRTVQNDLPHFTFLGRAENELTNFGLKKIASKFGDFWIPNV